MDRRWKTALWALGGLALAIALSMTAYAVAGGRLSEPAGSVRVIPSAAEEGHSPNATASPTPEPSSGGDDQPSQSDNHGGSSASPGSTSSGSDPGTHASDDDDDGDD